MSKLQQDGYAPSTSRKNEKPGDQPEQTLNVS